MLELDNKHWGVALTSGRRLSLYGRVLRQPTTQWKEGRIPIRQQWGLQEMFALGKEEKNQNPPKYLRSRNADRPSLERLNKQVKQNKIQVPSWITQVCAIFIGAQQVRKELWQREGFRGVLCRLLLYRHHRRLLHPFLLTKTETTETCVDVLSHREASTLLSSLTKYWENVVGEPRWHSKKFLYPFIGGRGHKRRHSYKSIVMYVWGEGLKWHTLACQVGWKRRAVGRKVEGKRKEGKGVGRG